MSAHQSYLSSLNQAKNDNLYRTLVESNVVGSVCVKRGDREFISFCCNDYFALSQERQVKDAAIAAIENYGVGSRASRYVTGNNALYSQLEKQIAAMKHCDGAIVFGSGYVAAIGVIPALVGKGDLIVADKLIHSSLIDGSKLSGAKLLRFRHNDIAHCREILQENRKQYDKCIIITETVFSMDGDVGDVDGLLVLSQEFDTLVISDDAHGLWLKHKGETSFLHDSTPKNHPPLEGGSKSEAIRGGVKAFQNQPLLGSLRSPILPQGLTPPQIILPLREDRRVKRFEEGSKLFRTDPSSAHCVHRSSLKGRMICGGVSPQGEDDLLDGDGKKGCDYPPQRWLQMGTLSKSVGCLGGYVAADAVTIDYLRNFAKSAIYSTALPPSVLASALQALQIIEQQDLGQKALDNAQYFCDLMKLPPAQSAIVPIIIGDNLKAVNIAKALEKEGMLISAIRPPTVPQGTARLRITFCSLHQKDQIKALAHIVNEQIKRD